jgi:catechol 2,3-dioxygenase-like lactoylglutathione lyase family enzyme
MRIPLPHPPTARRGTKSELIQERGRATGRGTDNRGVRYLGLVTVVVADYDEAIAFYTRSVGMELVEDTPLGGGKRWVVVRPRGAREAALLLARAATSRQRARVGDQTGGRVGLFLYTDDFDADYHRMRGAGVAFEAAPREEPYGRVAVFHDLYGNRWDLLQPSGAAGTAAVPDPPP